MLGTERKDDFYIKEIAVNLVNKAGVPVYLNNDITPGGVLLRQGLTWVDGDQFYIIARNNTPINVTIESKEWGHRCNRWAKELGKNQYRLSEVGHACGLSHMRGFNPDNLAHVTVTIERA